MREKGLTQRPLESAEQKRARDQQVKSREMGWGALYMPVVVRRLFFRGVAKGEMLCMPRFVIPKNLHQPLLVAPFC